MTESGPGGAFGKCVHRTCRMHAHSALPNMLTRSRSAAISGSSGAVGHHGLNGAAPVAESLAGPGSTDAPLMHT